MYESPIEIVYGQMQMNMEDNIMKAVQEYGIKVNKDDLISALMYDRHQYGIGYQDGVLSVQAQLSETLDSLESELMILRNHPTLLSEYCDGMKHCLESIKAAFYVHEKRDL